MIVGRIHLAAAAAAREPSRAALDEMGAAIDTWRAGRRRRCSCPR